MLLFLSCKAHQLTLQAESKLAVVEKQKSKLKEQIPKEKLEKSRKYRLIEKEVLKRTTKYTDARLKATKVSSG